MDSTIFNRRTLLGRWRTCGHWCPTCGVARANEAAATATAAPSESPSASAAASESPSASATLLLSAATPAAQRRRREYRGADPNGPAQNVPETSSPEDGYREKSNEGLAQNTQRVGLNGTTTAP